MDPMQNLNNAADALNLVAQRAGAFWDEADDNMAQNQAAFNAWRQDRDTLGELGAKGSRRMGVFQGFVVGTTDAYTSGATGHFLMDDAVVNISDGSNVYLHLKTHMNTAQVSQMFLYDVNGYAYGESNHIAGKVAGYCYATTGNLESVSAEGSHGLTAYEGSDGQVYLRMLLASTYYLTLSIDAIRVGNGVLPEVGSLTPIFSTEVTL